MIKKTNFATNRQGTNLKLNRKHKEIVQELIESSTAPVATLRHELTHILNVLEWINRIKPGASATISYAGLLHDCDRLFPERRAWEKDFPTRELYKRAHAKNCARIASVILFKLGLARKTTEQAQKIIEDHEWGSFPDSYTLMAADSLSFFSLNFLEYFKEKGASKTEKKIIFMYKRLKIKDRGCLRTNDMIFKRVPKLYNLFKRVVRKSL